ncbi:Prefoldin chaperone subunit family protein [Euphorbia peplus]|nr:Prefoldin chaperone subunit family protein [Euphorbia peplus]
MANREPAMDESQQDLQTLKSLSVMLLKEKLERQHQVESLLQAKESLEIQLGQITDEKPTYLNTEFVAKSEERACLESMKGLLSVFFENQMDTMGLLARSLVKENGDKENLIGFLKGENSVFKVKLEEEREKVSGIRVERDRLREKVIELEEKKSRDDEEIRKLNDHYKQSLEQLEKLKRDNVEIMSSSRCKLIELERSYENAANMAKVRAIKNDSLLEEKNDKEITIGKLMEEMDSRERLLKNLNAELKDKEGLIATLLRDKEQIEDVKFSKETDIVKLNIELVELRNAMVEMQDFIKIQQDWNSHLGYEVGQVKLHKHKAERQLDNETMINKDLTSRIPEMEKIVEDSVQELEKLMKQLESLLEEKRGMESQVVLLTKEKDSVMKTLLEAQLEVNDLRKKLESGILIMVKKAAEIFLVNGKKLLSGTELRLVDDIKLFATELEVVTNACRIKAKAVKGIKFLQNSVAKASKQDLLAAIYTFLFAVAVSYALRLDFVSLFRVFVMFCVILLFRQVP